MTATTRRSEQTAYTAVPDASLSVEGALQGSKAVKALECGSGRTATKPLLAVPGAACAACAASMAAEKEKVELDTASASQRHSANQSASAAPSSPPPHTSTRAEYASAPASSACTCNARVRAAHGHRMRGQEAYQRASAKRLQCLQRCAGVVAAQQHSRHRPAAPCSQRALQPVRVPAAQ